MHITSSSLYFLDIASALAASSSLTLIWAWVHNDAITTEINNKQRLKREAEKDRQNWVANKQGKGAKGFFMVAKKITYQLQNLFSFVDFKNTTDFIQNNCVNN